MKRAMFLFCGVCWLLFAVAAGIFSWWYLLGGADSQDTVFALQILSPVSSGSILVGLVHVVGFVTLTVFCLLIGTGLLLHGLIWHPSDDEKMKSLKVPPNTALEPFERVGNE